jgi:hypothetical protein
MGRTNFSSREEHNPSSSYQMDARSATRARWAAGIRDDVDDVEVSSKQFAFQFRSIAQSPLTGWTT